MDALAADSKHLTPRTLAIELSKMSKEVQVYAIHIKPQSHVRVIEQISQMNRPQVIVGEIGREYVF